MIHCLSIIAVLILNAISLQSQIQDSVHLFPQQAQSAPPCQTIVGLLDETAKALDSLARVPQRDSALISIVEHRAFTVHQRAIECRYSLTAMMSMAASNAAQKLRRAENILLFRLQVRDVRAFLDEARKYYNERR